MSAHALTDELSDIRTHLLRLRRRERQLQDLIDRGPIEQGLRPGWPIQRLATPEVRAN